MNDRLASNLNAAGLLAICAVLAYAFVDQFAAQDLPCPLCLLQRMGFCLAGFGLALNLRFGQRASHYGVVILGAAAGLLGAVRQVLLHIVPGTGSYGDPFLGLHFYTWAAILFALIIVGTAVLLLLDGGLQGPKPTAPAPGIFGWGVLIVFALLLAGNGVSTLLECELGLCPDNPTRYLLLRPGGAGGE